LKILCHLHPSLLESASIRQSSSHKYADNSNASREESRQLIGVNTHGIVVSADGPTVVVEKKLMDGAEVAFTSVNRANIR
jgi:hypothetical protein